MAALPSGLQTAFTYDPLDRCTALSTPVSSYTYQLGPVGNRLSATEGTGRALTWNYDGIYRMTNETIASAPAKANGTVAYSLDLVGVARWVRRWGGTGSGGPGGTGAGPRAPGGPPPPPHWIVWVNWRPLLKFSNLAFGHHPLGHWHHTYISIYNPDLGTETWGVLGENGGGKNQQVLYDDPRNNSVGGGETEIPCADSEAQTLESAINATDYASGRECPTCGKNYHNWWWRQPPDGNNSYTYTYNMIHNWGKTTPTELNAPGYELSSGYARYF